LNNELDPYTTCQVTSMVMGLDIAGFELEPIMRYSKYRQPEDKLRWYMLNDPDVEKYWKKSHPTTIDIPAPEWADCMVYAINKLYDKKICFYEANLTIQKIISDLKEGLPIYTSMRYPDNKNFTGKPSPVTGHIVLIIGIDEDKLLINDPYKNHLTGDKDGFKNIYTPEDFAKHNKGYAIRYKRA